jgi:hypothetical protein
MVAVTTFHQRNINNKMSNLLLSLILSKTIFMSEPEEAKPLIATVLLKE